MGLRKVLAQGVSAAGTGILKHVFRRPAANFPGKVALYVDPHIIADLAPKLERGSIMVVGTNGKTTVTNMLADALEAAGMTVLCNRTGANLDSGIATTLLQGGDAQWGVFESDELWLAKSLPQLQPRYVLLLNLFRDQLDRCGEIDTIQQSIIGALSTSPDTVVVYNADDPFCEGIARRVDNRAIAFGIGEDLHLEQNTVSDSSLCQMCPSFLEYDFRQYGQLGAYHCPSCGFARSELDFSARHCTVTADGLDFDVDYGVAMGTVHAGRVGENSTAHLHLAYSGIYLIYNVLAVFAAARLASAPVDAIQKVAAGFDARNGRLQSMRIAGHDVLLNLAKNPTGFNQNLKIIMQDPAPKVVAFFINDREADGHDISWIWDIDFEELAADAGARVFAGGIRRNDMQLRLKYAGIGAELTDGATALMETVHREVPADVRVYVIAGYTALRTVHPELTALAEASDVAERADGEGKGGAA